ncbi:LysR family transcriptional regulator [Marinomonas sp. S3726]|uniref:LysR substrate-binding domain-containing protein n=1 Tax=Marinomonas sp. S3726 TaxID=579484 RepID=UPI0005FA71A1|nr:LysR substrate-binding domain-containing protein [Marinomonas sp. S3726]KJZ10322.1 LysR family transcriptional regulator [Marinomonas sp. S3726]
MDYQLPPLNWLRAFETAARYNNFTLASKELNLTSAAVSHQVRSLEQHLGFQLFERLARSLKLTDKGRAYLPSVRRAFEDLSASTIGLFGSKGRQSISVRCTAAFSMLWLVPRLNDFMQKYPNIDVRLYTAIWTEALSQDDIDIDIRFGDGNWPGFNSQEILHLPSVVVATEESKERVLNMAMKRDKNLPHDLRCVQIMGCEGRWQKIIEEKLNGINIGVTLTVDTSLSALKLACCGMGVALVQEIYAEPYLKDGRLVKVFDEGIYYDESHYILMPDREMRAKPESLLFKNWLLEQSR